MDLQICPILQIRCVFGLNRQSNIRMLCTSEHKKKYIHPLCSSLCLTRNLSISSEPLQMFLRHYLSLQSKTHESDEQHHESIRVPCQQEADDVQRTTLQWWCHRVCVLQLAVRWTGQNQPDGVPPRWTELAADRASSWSFEVTTWKQVWGLLCRVVTGNYAAKKLFSWPWQRLVAQSFFRIDDCNIFLPWLFPWEGLRWVHHCSSSDRCSSAT